MERFSQGHAKCKQDRGGEISTLVFFVLMLSLLTGCGLSATIADLESAPVIELDVTPFVKADSNLKSTITVTAKNAKGEPVADYLPEIEVDQNLYFESSLKKILRPLFSLNFSKLNMVISCGRTSPQGVAQCELVMPVPEEQPVELALRVQGRMIVLPTPVVVFPRPTLTAVSEAAVSFDVPETVILTGTQFRSGMEVFIDGQSCSSVVVKSSTEAECQTPLHDRGGPYNIAVRAPDQQETTLASAISFADQSPPSLAFTFTPPTRSNQLNLAFQFSMTDNVDSSGQISTQCRLNEGTFINCSSPYNITASGLTNGETQSFIVKAVDQSGNSQEFVYSWVYDAEAPTLVITNQNSLSPSPSKNTASRTLSLGGDDVVAYKFQVINSGSCTSVDFSSLAVYSLADSPTISFGPLTEQAYTLCAIGKDSSGNWQAAAHATASSTLVIDTHVSAFSNLEPLPASPSNNLIPVLRGNAEAGATVALYRDSATCAGTPLATTLAHSTTGAFSASSDVLSVDGTYQYYFKATDVAGNTLCSGPVSYLLDRVPPVLGYSSPAEMTKAPSQITVTGTCEAGAQLTYSGSGILSPFSQTCPGTGNFSQVLYFSAGDGEKAITLTQTDVAGNSASLTKTFIRDSTPPLLSQTLAPVVAYSKLNTTTFGGACESGIDVMVGGADSGSVACVGSAWSYIASEKTSDGIYSYTFTQTDAAGNQTSVSSQFVRDNVAPSLVLDSANPLLTAADSATWNGSCESGLSITVSGALTSSISCSGGFWTLNVSANTDGTREYTLKQIDPAGNEQPLTLSWTRDTSVPEIQLGATQTDTFKNALNSVTWSGTCETGLDVVVSGADTQSFACPAGTWNYSTPSQGTDGLRTYTLTQTNSISGASSSITLKWYRDTQGPALQTGLFFINDGASTTSARQVQVDLKAIDSLTNVSHFCLKTIAGANPAGPPQPPADDNCWTAVNAPRPGLALNKTLQLNDFLQPLDFIDGTYTLFAWVKDEVGNISSLGNSGAGVSGTDKASITLTQGNPPTISGLFGSRTDSSYPPLLPNDEVALAGNTLYIKWKAEDDQTLPNTSVRLFFTTNDTDWTEITASGGIANGVNGACSLSGDYTGCFLWQSPVNGFLRIRALITDAIGKQAMMSSNAINTSPMRILAGNPSTGLGGDGKVAVFLKDPNAVPNRVQPHSFVVTRSGDIYLNDHYKGILKISAETGLVTQFIKQTGVSSGDGGPISSATTKYAYKLALDPLDRLWVWDYDRIRRIDIRLPNPAIQTVIGGGSDTNDTVADPLHLEIMGFAYHADYAGDTSIPFTFSANGNLYFASETISDASRYADSRVRIRVYRSDLAVPKIESIVLGGVGFSGNTTQSLTGCGSVNRGLGFSATGTLEMIYGVAVKNNNISKTGDCYTTSGTSTHYPVRFDPASGLSTAPHPPAVASTSGSGFQDFVPVTGRNGKLYIISKNHNRIYRYDYNPSFSSSGVMTLIAGNGTLGTCPEGAAALSCSMNFSDVFVDEQNRMYIFDNGQIRLVKEDGNLVTIAGININQGITEPAVMTRYAGLTGLDLDLSSTPAKLIATDVFFQRMFEVTPYGNSRNIAGNGLHGVFPSTSSPASSTHYIAKGNDTFAHVFAHPTSGLIYATSGARLIGALDRTADQWTTVLGGGATSLEQTASNTPGLDLKYTSPSPATGGYAPVPLGWANGKLLVASTGGYSSSGTIWSNLLSLSDTADAFKTNVFAGIVGENYGTYGFCAEGTPTSSCKVGLNRFVVYTRSYYDDVSATWLISHKGAGTIYRMGTGKNVEYLPMPHTFLNFAYRRNGAEEIIYYCNAESGRIHKQILGGVNTEINWPLTSIKCSGLSMVIDESRNVLIFIYEANGLMGLIETSDF